MTDKELLQEALDAILAAIESGDWKVDGACDPDWVIEAIKARLAQLEQDDGYCQACDVDNCTAKEGCVAYDNPPKKEWVGLTDEEIKKLSDDCVGVRDETEFMRAIEAKLKEKNNV